MKISYLIVGLAMLTLLSIGCIGNKTQQPLVPNSDLSISSRMKISENSGIFSEQVKPTLQNREHKLPCANKIDKYTATYNNGDYLEIWWLNSVIQNSNDSNNSICEQINRFNYVSGNNSYEQGWNSFGNFEDYAGHTGAMTKNSNDVCCVPEPNYPFTKDDVTKEYNEFSKVAHAKVDEIVKRHESGQLTSFRDSKFYMDRTNMSSIGNFVIKISGTPGLKFTGTISTKTGGYSQLRNVVETVPKEIIVDNLESLDLQKQDVGIMTLQIIEDNKLVESDYSDNRIPIKRLIYANLKEAPNPNINPEDTPITGETADGKGNK